MNDDAISRRAVLKLLYALPPEEATTKATLIQSVKQMDAEPEQRWIPCSERLPTKPGRYLITQERHYGLYVTAVYFDGNEFFDEAVAWMPTPEPYKGGSK